jgi:hypothetical protein
MPTVTGTFAYLSDLKCFFGWVSGTKDSLPTMGRSPTRAFAVPKTSESKVVVHIDGA